MLTVFDVDQLVLSDLNRSVIVVFCEWSTERRANRVGDKGRRLDLEQHEKVIALSDSIDIVALFGDDTNIERLRGGLPEKR